HSGDSACVIPPLSIPAKHLETVRDYNRRVAVELGVVGLMNVQYAIGRDVVYILEANPRASRTVPLVSKVCNIQMARIATQFMLGARMADVDLRDVTVPYFGVKESVFPFTMFPEVDPVLGPEMRSTGEVLGLGRSFGQAYFKAQEAAMPPLPVEGTVLITVNRNDRPAVLEVARQFRELGFRILATRGTHAFLAESGLEAELVCKVNEGRPSILDVMTNRQVHLVINTPVGRLSKEDDSYIRKAAIKYRIPYITTLTAALAAAKGIAARRASRDAAHSLQEYHGQIVRQNARL
ncbi:MAG: carbamoyl phosphate synthase large subunit, partial [Planctomycetes bacterium]|nr:carbamoyl phosphate synthase large subunit [Planctomycetota bacterium]